MTVAVGVDLGSSSARAVAIDRDGAVRGTSSAPYPGQSRWATGHADPESWRKAVHAALDQLAAQLPAASTPAALGVGGQSPAVVNADGTDAITIVHPSGASSNPTEAHALMAMHVARSTSSDQRHRTVLLQAWDHVLVELGAEPFQGRWPGTGALVGFGEERPTGTVVGAANGRWGVAAGTPLVPGAADAYMAFWAAGIDRPGRALDPGGRTGGIGMAVPTLPGALSGYALRSPVRDVDIVGGPVAAHGITVDWWATMTGRSIDVALAEAAEVPAGADGVLVLPYLLGERAPHWNPNLRGEIFGLTTDTGPAHVMRAALEGCAFGIRHIIDTLRAQGHRLDTLVVGGSPARSPLWCQIKSDVLGVPVEIPEFPDLAAYGAALAAGAAVGWWAGPGSVTSGDWPTARMTVIEPGTTEPYESAYRRWLEVGDAAVARAAATGEGKTEDRDTPNPREESHR